MFGDIFLEEGANQDTGGTGGGQTFTSSYKARGKNCASDLDFAPLEKQQSNFVGLDNQGGTCYLNSLFQTLFMTPQFRQAIFQLPLCGNSIDEPSNFLKSKKKREILFAIQKLFVMLQEEDVRATNTHELTKSFGWGGGDVNVQHDAQELSRLLFDTIERGLKDTAYETLIQELYTGMLNKAIICQKCGVARKRQESFVDLGLQVKGCKGVEESLTKLFEYERFFDDNRLTCDNCNEKTDSLMGQKIQRLPPVLNFCLLRFEFDYQTMERKKVNDRFEYPLELNMAPYLDTDSTTEEFDSCQYELKSIIIHSGGPYSGHYIAYIKDDLNEGNWHLQMPEKYEPAPVPVEKKVFVPENYMTEEQIKQMEESKNEPESAIQIDGGEAFNGQFDIETQDALMALQKAVQQIDQSQTQGFQGKKGKNKQNKQNKQKNKQQQQNQKNKGGKQQQQQHKKKNDQQKEVEIEYDYDNCDFPLPYSEQRLVQNWFEFDDSAVRPILPGKLQSQFGGSRRNAYILVYRQKKLNNVAEGNQKPEVPQYWRQVIENMNEMNKHQRIFHKEMENQLDIIVQDESLFNIDPETQFVNYIKDTEIEKQGVKIRVKFNDTIEQVRTKIEEQTGLSGLGQEFDMFEVNRLKSSFCQLINPFNKHENEKLVKDSKITHLSTWMIVRNNPDLASKLSNVTGEEVFPINVRMRFFGDEAAIQVYNNQTLAELINKISDMTTIPTNQMSLKVVEENLIRRIDKHIYNQDNPDKMNTLKDVKIVENTALLVEMKSEQELAKEEEFQVINNTNPSSSNAQQNKLDIVKIDETTYLRTVIVNTELDKEDFQRFTFNLDWNLKELTNFLAKEMKLEEPQRLRNLTFSRLFVREELETPLRNYPDFMEGGARIQIEEGRYPTMAEILIKVALNSNLNDIRQFFVSSDITVLEFKQLVCKELPIQTPPLDPVKSTLYRVNYLDEPVYPIRRDKQQITKCNVSSGDLLILKSDADLLPEEKLCLNVHLTTSGLPEDSQMIDKVEVNREYTLKELKEIILSMPQFEFAKDLGIEYVRLRERQKSMFFGRIFRDHTKTLKQLSINTNSQIVVQFLTQPEELKANQLILLVSKRDIGRKEFFARREMIFTFPEKEVPNMRHLEQNIKGFFELSESDKITIAKYFIPNAFDWKILDPNEDVTVKRKKKEFTQKADTFDLRSFPYMLKDGDIIGVRFESENTNLEQIDTDFSTEQDLENKEKFRALQEAEKIEREKNKSNQSKKPKKAEVQMKIYDEDFIDDDQIQQMIDNGTFDDK